MEEEEKKGGTERGKRTEGRSTGAVQGRSGREEEPGEGKSRPESYFVCFGVLLLLDSFGNHQFFFFEGEVAQGGVISLS